MPQIETSVLGIHLDCLYFVTCVPKIEIQFPRYKKYYNILYLGNLLIKVQKAPLRGAVTRKDPLNQLTFIRCSLAFLLQSTPFTSFGTRKSVANFSVSVSAASNARKHFRTGSEKTLLGHFDDTTPPILPANLPTYFSIYYSTMNVIVKENKITSKSRSSRFCGHTS